MWLIRCGIVVGCRTGNTSRDFRQVSPAAGSGNNASRDVVIETVHARHADALTHLTNNCVVQGMYRDFLCNFFVGCSAKHAYCYIIRNTAFMPSVADSMGGMPSM